MAEALDMSALEAELTAYINGQGPDVLVKDAMTSMDSVEHVTVLEVRGKQPLFGLTVGNNLIQPSNRTGAYNATQAIDYVQRYLDPQAGKMDLDITPQTYYANYLARNRRAGAANAYQMSFEEFLINEVIMEQVKRHLEKSTIWSGVRNYATKTAVGIADGFLTLVTAQVADDTADFGAYVDTGAITSSNAVDKLEEMKLAIPAELRMSPLKCFVSPVVYDYYCADYRASYGALPYNNQFNKTYLEGSEIELVPRAGMGTSQRVIITPKDNIYIGFDLASDLNQITIEKAKRVLNIMMDFSIGMNFARWDQVITNDPTP
jgi:hypothetical protein